LAYDAASSLLCSGSFDQFLFVWKIGAPGREAETKLVAKLAGHPSRVKSVAFSPDGQSLVSGDASGHVILWDTKQYTALLAFKAHASGVASVQLLPTAHSYLLLTSSFDKTAKLWRIW